MYLSLRDGDMLSDAAGVRKENGLEIEVLVAGAENACVSVNGTEAKWNGSCHVAKILLTGYSNRLTASQNGREQSITVYWLPNAAGKYAISVDDNIWAFADLTKNKDTYTSIFDNAYLNVYKQAHDLYGATVRLNLFYEMDNPCGLELYGPFDLSMMTDRYKDEFIANSNWLHLAFHAKSEFPDAPYAQADTEQFKTEYQEIIREIKRFAGEQVIEKATTNHWGTGTADIVRAEKTLGIDALMGYMELDEGGRPFVSYYLTPEQTMHVNEYGFWKDHETGMIFGKIDAVLNLYDSETACRMLEEGKRKYPKKGFIEVMIHEQYFYPAYANYLPDFKERVLSACKWCVEHGYEGAFASDAIAF